MRVCLVNTFHYRRGGDCTYTFDLADLLRSKGHDVIHFAMKHPENLDSEYAEYFAEHVDFQKAFRSGGPAGRAGAFLRSLASKEAKAKFARLLDDTGPDIIHLQNFRRHLTFSIVEEAKRRRIPVVFTAHDYDPICPNSLLLAHGRICTVCRGRDYWRPIFVRCKEDSVLGSLAIALEGIYTKLKRCYDLIDVIVTPSRFARERLIEGGFDPAKVEVIHNFIDVSAYEPRYGGTGFIYFGRLVIEKGIESLIEAASGLEDVTVQIAGEGPRRAALEELSVKLKAGNVEFLGYVERAGLHGMVRDALAVVMPSIWFENFPYSILEAFALGKPVVAAEIGGMPETVAEGRTGLLFQPGDAQQLAGKLAYLKENLPAAEAMGRNARERVETEFDGETHYRKLMEIYERLL